MFDGSLNSFGQQTLNSFDQLTGRGESNTLDATISSSVTPALLSNIQTVDVTATAAATLGLLNATGTTSIANDGSSAALTFSNVGAGATTVGVRNTSSATTINYASTTGAQSINLNLANVGAVAPAVVTIAGVETVAIASNEATNSVDLELAAATTLTASGSANLTISPLSTGGNTVRVSSLDASAMTGNLTVDMGTQSGVLASTAITVTGGAGNDSIGLSGLGQSYIATGGAGNDTFTDTAITNTRGSIEGGDGVDTLSTTYARASALTTVNGVNGIDILSLSDALGGNLTLANVDSTINTLNLVVNGALNTVASNVTGPAGALTVNLGTSAAAYVGALTNTLTLTDTGSAATDSLAINNLAVDSATGTNTNVFNGNSITSAGYENVTISTGASSNVAGGQTINTLTITSDSASAPVSLTVTGSNSLSITSLASNSTGLTTVDASALTARAAGTNTFTITGTALGTAASTLSVTGSAGDDVVNVGAANTYSATVMGGAGNDNLTGGVAADQLHGEAGNDTLVGSGGNDTIKGGEGNDTIDSTAAGVVNIDGGAGNDTVSMAGTLTATDVVDGGDGTDTLAVTAAITGTTGVGVKNFETLSTTVDQVLTNAVNNTWTTVLANAAGVDVTNALSTTTTFQVNENADGGAASLARLTDTGADSLTFATAGTGALAFDGTITALTVNDEESLTIDVSNGADTVAGSLAITALNAADLKTLTLTGDHNVTIAAAIGGNTALATVDASGLTGNATVNAGNSTVAVTMTGSATGINTFTGGLNADSITGGAAADVLAGGNGADTLVGNGGNDNLTGGAGADSINAGTGTDNITAGTQADTVTLTADAQRDTVNQGVADSVASTATAFQGATFAAGDTITFANGVDVINNFLAGVAANGGDLLNIGTVFSTSVLGSATGTATIGWLSGNYANGIFTVTANGVGADTLVLQASSLGGASRAVVLAGVDSDNLVNSNFGGVDGANVVPLLSAGNAFTVEAGSIASGRAYISTATGIFSDALGVALSYVSPNPATGWVAGTQAALTSVDMSNLNGGFGVNVTLDGATSTLLTAVTGTSGDDNLIYADGSALGAAGVAISGGTAGNDTLRFTNFEANQAGLGGGGGGGTLTNIDNVALTNGTLDSDGTTVRTLTIANGQAVALAITNSSATAAATVELGSGAAHSFNGASSNGLQTITIAQAAQSVTAGGNASDDIIYGGATGAQLTGSFDGGTGVTDTFTSDVTGGAGTLDVSGATFAGIETFRWNGNDTTNVTMDETNVQSFGAITGGGGAETLTLTRSGSGVFDFTSTALTAVGTVAITTAGSTVRMNNADIPGTLTGSAAGTTTIEFANTALLSGVNVSRLDVVTVAAGADLTVDGSDFTPTNFNTVTGGTASDLFFNEAANTDLTDSAISGFATVNFSAIGNNTLTIDGGSFATGTSIGVIAATGADVDLVVDTSTNISDWTIDQTGGNTTFDTIVLTDAAGVTNTLTANSSILGAALNSVTATSAATTGVNTFAVTALAATSALDISAITTVTNLDAISLTGSSAGANVVTVAANDVSADDVRAITTVNLQSDPFVDQVILNNDTVAATSTSLSASITGFTAGAGGDQISVRTAGADHSNGTFYNAFDGSVLAALSDGDVLEIDANTVTFGLLENAAAVLAWLAANGVTSAAGNDYATIIAYNGGGTAGVYQAFENTAAGSAYDRLELIGTVNALDNSMVATNFF